MDYRKLLCVLAFGFTVMVMIVGQFIASVIVAGTLLRWTYHL